MKEVVFRGFRTKDPSIYNLISTTLTQTFTTNQTYDLTTLTVSHLKSTFLKYLKAVSPTSTSPITQTPEYPLIHTLTSIKIKAVATEIEAAKILQRSSAKERKKGSLDQQVEDDVLNESGAKSKLAINQGQIINNICTIYFEGLQSSVERESELNVNLCVKGLTNFGHLINIEVINRLMRVFKRLLVGDEGVVKYNIGVLSSLSCVLCCYSLSKHEVEETKDGGWLIDAVYKTLLRADGGGKEEVETVLKCLEEGVLKRREIRRGHVQGLIKKLLSVSLNTGTGSGSAAIITMCRMIVSRYKGTERGVEVEDCMGEGYDGGTEDVGMSNPFGEGGGFWELGLEKFSYQPEVRNQANGLAKQSRLDTQPQKVHEREVKREETIAFPLKEPKKHPLLKGMVGMGAGSGKKRRRGLGEAKFVKGGDGGKKVKIVV
ncbi:hypothetical protein TrLO_g6360 [Triparma laevis f. longispina]|nr:hypothetical protein TrLO_g6360 [Triparma laevis f. longispina]